MAVTRYGDDGVIARNRSLAWVGPDLPLVASDGDEILYWHSGIDSGWYLKFQGTNWFFLGGTPLRSSVETSQSTTSSTYVDLGTVGPSIVVPLAGTYGISYGADVETGVSASSQASLTSPKIGAAVTSDNDSIGVATHPISGNLDVEAAISRTKFFVVAAGDTVKLQYRSFNAGNTSTFSGRWITILPLYVHL